MSESNNLNHRFNEKAAAIVAAAVGHCLWGFSYLFTRLSLNVTSHEILLSVRFLIAFVIMNLMMLSGKCSLSLKGKPLIPLLALAIMEPVYFYFESYGILYTNATYSGVVLSVVPIVGLLLAAVFLKEYPSRKQVVFCVFPIAGVIMITLSGSELGIVKPFGIFLLLCSLFASATYRTLNRKASENFTTFERTYFIIGISAVVFTISGLISVKGDISAYTEPFGHWEFVVSVLTLSIFCSVLCHSIVNYAAGKMSVVTLSVYGTLSTICSMFAGVIFLGEPLTAVSFIGSLLIIFGIRQVTAAAPH